MNKLLSKNLSKYKDNGYEFIKGWCRPQLFGILDIFNNLDFNKRGGILEIGVHHGKFFLMLNSIVEQKYRSVAIDLFDNQKLNIDNSGFGSYSIFCENLKNYDVNGGINVDIYSGDSTDLNFLKRIPVSEYGYRYISIDGGHTAEHTKCDLTTAENLISNEGVVFLDDILNHHWLGVLNGTVSFLQSRPTLVPFALGYNKLLLAKISYKDKYLNSLSSLNYPMKKTNFFGHNCISLG